MKDHEIQRIMLTPKLSTLVFTSAACLVVGLTCIMILGLLILDPLPRIIIGGGITITILLPSLRQITEKNRCRLQTLEKILSTTDKPEVERITTNPIKPGKTFRISDGSESVNIPEKRWIKLAPILNLPSPEV